MDGKVIADPKVVSAFNDTHIAQMLGYLTITDLEVALLLNFKEPKLQMETSSERAIRVSSEFRGRRFGLNRLCPHFPGLRKVKFLPYIADAHFRSGMARKDRFDMSAAEVPFEMNNPFANLHVDNLPLGDTPAPAPAPAPKAKALGRVVLRRETAHRGGKIVIVIHDFAPYISNKSIEDLGKKLRSACGCGGTTKERQIEIQGNQVDRIRSLLEQEGYRVAGVKA